MSNVFKQYSDFYDLLYNDKDYTREVNYIDQIIKERFKDAKTILDLGCGTGIHANLLATMGYEVVGIDFSDDMIRIANEKKNNQYILNSEKLNFYKGDVTNLELGKKFDVVLSLFHVFSYLNSNKSVLSGFETINKHLKLGGLAIFDFWYGPGVLTDLPQVRNKLLEDEKLKISRIAIPLMRSCENVVDVNYELNVEVKKNREQFLMNEKHSMRYFFKPELELFACNFGYSKIDFYNWLEFKEPDLKSWNACMVISK